RGKPVLVSFFAFWCDTWKDEVRRLKELRAGNPGLDFQVVFLSVDARDRSLTVPLMQREGVFFPVLVDSRSEVSRSWGITTVPTLLVLDGQGVIRHVHQGYPGNHLLSRELASCRSTHRVALSAPDLTEFLLPEERSLLNRLNAERRGRGLAPLQLDPTMTEVGRERLQRMLETNRPGHFTPESPAAWLRARGLSFPKVGENLARADGPDQALSSMLESPSHKENLLYPGYRRVGVAALRAGSGYLFCILFGGAPGP
ncbi:MAG: CAP domain-containing protein, partial [Candidatus Eremiobacterota bacterium]